MLRAFTHDEVLRLAPDAGSAKSGQELAQVRKWKSLGADGEAVWGECQGSGAKPYQVQIALAEPAFKCSCPSRKFPCKHGLGLLLILAATPEAIAIGERPAWVSEWLAMRAAKAAKGAESPAKKEAPRDPAAQSKRRGQRMERARAGLADLSAWERDMVRGGLGAMPSKGFAFFDGQARRMVDAQAPGVARLVRELASLASSGAGWQRPFLEQLALIHLLVRAVDRYDALPDTLRADIETAIGLTTTAQDLADLPGVNDRWQALAQETELEDRLRVQRTWLCGVESRRIALVLQFAHGAAAFEYALSPGTLLTGELVYYPGSGPRAALRAMTATGESLTALAGWKTMRDLLDVYSSALASNPWLEQICIPLEEVTPVRQGEAWFVVDSAQAALSVRIRDAEGFTLLAVSGGRPVDLAATYDGCVLRPLGVVADGAFLSLAPTLEEAAR